MYGEDRLRGLGSGYNVRVKVRLRCRFMMQSGGHQW